MNYYHFSQNNSGGKFDVDGSVCEDVFIEADGRDSAMEKARSLGIYMDGVRDGIDCGCCGDRWSEPDELVFPYRFGTFDGDEAERLSKEYGATYGKTTWRFLNTHEPDPTKYDIVFDSVESYAKFLIGLYGSPRKQAYIYRADGTKVVV